MFSDIAVTAKLAIRVLAKDRARFIGALALCAAGGAIELAGVGTLYPFLSLLARPELIETNSLLHSLYGLGGFASARGFMIAAGCVALAFFCLASLFLFIKSAFITRYCVSQASNISTRLLDAYLRKPMAFHLTSNSGALSKNVIEQSDQFANVVLLSVMTLFADGVIFLVLVALVLFAAPRAGLAAIGAMGLLFGMVLSVTRSRLSRLGKASDEASGARFVYVIGALQAIKEIKTSGRENFFVEQFRQHTERQAECYSKVSIIQLVPSFLAQFTAASIIIMLALYYLVRGIEITAIMPTLLMYSVVGYRLVPSLSKLAAAIANLRQSQVVVHNVSSILSEAVPTEPLAAHRHSPLNDALPAVEFRHVAFAYEGVEQALFRDLSFQIAPKTLVGLAGPSGAGKTTIVDIMLGLLSPHEGEVLLQGVPLHSLGNRELRKIFAYVPQSVYLTDGTIADNIAFGISHADIDWNRLREVVRLCHLEDFVGTKAEGLLAPVGERGARLSGGQRQRIGIARALYESPAILILDESTSSLDGISEQAIIATLMELKQSMTIVTIAHRKSLVQHCDRIILLNQASIAGDGSFKQLMESSPLFSMLMSEAEGGLP